MKNASDFARAAAELSTLGDQMRPQRGDPFENKRNVAVTYLRLASKEARELAEAIAERERTK